MSRSLTKISDEIQEKTSDISELVLVGIRTGGAHLANRLKRRIKRKTGVDVPLAALDITLYRDDIYRGDEVPVVRTTNIPFDVNDKFLVLVDDVLFTGRTIRAAMDQIVDFGRPKVIKLAVLVDRGHREFPIQPDFVAIKLKTERDQVVQVYLKEEGRPDDRVTVVTGVN